MRRFIEFEQIIDGTKHRLASVDITFVDKEDKQIIDLYATAIKSCNYVSINAGLYGVVISRKHGPISMYIVDC